MCCMHPLSLPSVDLNNAPTSPIQIPPGDVLRGDAHSFLGTEAPSHGDNTYMSMVQDTAKGN